MNRPDPPEPLYLTPEEVAEIDEKCDEILETIRENLSVEAR